MKKKFNQLLAVALSLAMVVGFVYSTPPTEVSATVQELHEDIHNSYTEDYNYDENFTFDFAGSSAGDIYSVRIDNYDSLSVCLEVKVDEYLTDGEDYGITGYFTHDETAAYSIPHEWKFPLEVDNNYGSDPQYFYIKIGKDIPSDTNCTYDFTITMTCQDDCEHCKDESTVNREYATSTEHTVTYDCAWCGKNKAFEETGAHSGFAATGEASTDTTHYVACAVCGYRKSVSCSFTETGYEKLNGNCHYKQVCCSECTNVESSTAQKHTVVNGKCKYCGTKVVTPGKTKIKKITKLTPTKNKTTVTGHWAGSSWIPSSTGTSYKYPLKIKFKKAKNAKKYIISLKKPSTTLDSLSGLTVTKKTTYTFKNPTKGAKAKKITIYITPVSKTGTYGKTVKKKVKLKQP
ncbi:MAG: hypothetical protein K5840_08030 [Eubacterium sp.]|nr:hypothetical protein [Eubacterium sp.]